MLSIYLAGAIRDDHPEDIEWRENAITALDGIALCLNPLGGKTYNADTKEWLIHGQVAGAEVIVKHDFWCIDHVDAAIFNFAPMADGYPSIGTLIEFGRASARGILAYSVISPGYTGHGNTAMFKLHPFIERNSSMVFTDIDSCIDFVAQHLLVMGGRKPRFGGIIELQRKATDKALKALGLK